MALSIVIALALWAFVTSSENPEGLATFNDIRIEIRGLGADYAVAANLPTAQVRLRYRTDPLLKGNVPSPTVYVDLSGLGIGRHAVPVQVQLPAGPYRWEVFPSSVEVTVDRLATVSVPARVAVADRPPFGFTVGPAQVQPPQVQVSGPDSLVGRVVAVMAQITLEGRQASFEGDVTPVPVDSQGQRLAGLKLEPEAVHVVLPLVPEVGYKTVPVKPVLKGEPTSGYLVSSIVVTPQTVTVYGDPTALAGVDSLETRPVDISGAKENIHSTVQLVVPEGIAVTRNSDVTVTVELSTISTRMVVALTPNLINLRPGLSGAVSPTQVNVTLAGPLWSLQGLDLGSVKVTLDCKDLGEGTYQIQPAVSVPQGVSVNSVAPAQVTVTIFKTP
jgi:YbbR domain-containing protein